MSWVWELFDGPLILDFILTSEPEQNLVEAKAISER